MCNKLTREKYLPYYMTVMFWHNAALYSCNAGGKQNAIADDNYTKEHVNTRGDRKPCIGHIKVKYRENTYYEELIDI